jgi:hypothetical protein
MKLTFAPKTFAARSLRCATLAGPAVLGPYRRDDAQAVCTGAVAGEDFRAGATIGQDYHTGATTGLCNG